MCVSRLALTILVAGLLAGACSKDRVTSPSDSNASSPPPSSATPPPPTSGSCDASKAQWAVGQRASNDLLERARNAAGAGTARFLRPDQPITMEYSAGRLNLGLDKRDVVIAVTCG